MLLVFGVGLWDVLVNFSKHHFRAVVVVDRFLARVAVVSISPYERGLAWVAVVSPAERGVDGRLGDGYMM